MNFLYYVKTVDCVMNLNWNFRSNCSKTFIICLHSFSENSTYNLYFPKSKPKRVDTAAKRLRTSVIYQQQPPVEQVATRFQGWIASFVGHSK